ncbi:MAG: nucleotidyltransferase family protein [Acidobacteriia bacterium]|jgi:predicted nucleotidyltransferase|nr:nucleotidyltransferase family protein [Terriglobia bacterium]
MTHGVPIPAVEIAAFCQKNHIRKLSLFGSMLREDFDADSDVDVLVEFDPEYIPGFFHLSELEQELSQIFGGRRVDLVTLKFLNHRIRDRILATAKVQYAR